MILKFRGLQSYREEQLIDFGKLGAAGIFGVFGPTGAGKSTILDGITLALYGKVTRAKNGTRGIMNQYEDRLAVSFEFSLGGERYLAERLYYRDRHDSDSIKIKNVRLLQASSGSVLADKAGDMDAKMTELLGMSYEDFSRAVIVPQGKFDQFLKLTGGERARMLENILRLERYGEQLSKKVTDLENELKSKLETNKGLLAQLGEASKEAIEVLKADLKRQEQLVLQQDLLRKNAENKFRELEKIAGLHSELEVMMKEKQRLDTEKPEVDKLREKLDKASKAEPMRRLLEQEEELIRKTADAREFLNRLEENLAEAEKKEAGVLNRLQSAEKKEPVINDLKERELPRAAMALAYEKQVSRLEAETLKIGKDIEEKTCQMDMVFHKGSKQGEILEKAKGQSESYKIKREDLSRILECRGALEKSLSALSELETAEKQEIEAGTVLAGKQKAVSVQTAKILKTLSENMEVPDTNLDEKGLLYLMERVAEVVKQASGEKRIADEYMETVMTANMAGELANRLRTGQPCPVCGSQHHPFPASETAADNNKLDEARDRVSKAGEKLEQLLKWQQEAGIEYNIYKKSIEDIKIEYLPNRETKTLILAGAVAKFKAAVTHLEKNAAKAETNFLGGLIGDLYQDREKVYKAKNILDNAEKNIKFLDDEIRASDENIKAAETELVELRSSYRELAAQKASLEKLQEATNKSLSEQQNGLNEITGGKTAAIYEETVRQQISLLEIELTEARRIWELLQNEKRQMAQELAVAAAGMSALSDNLNQLCSELQAQVTNEGFENTTKLREYLIDQGERNKIQNKINEYDKLVDYLDKGIKGLRDKIGNEEFDCGKLDQAREILNKLSAEYKECVGTEGALRNQLAVLNEKHCLWNKLREEKDYLERRKELAGKLASLLKGRKYVQFLAEEHLRDMAAEASLRLGSLTGQRYSLEIDEDGSFVMRDDYSGSQRRPVNTLSGGETFLTSLALALALSSKIQLKGQYPLGFFFLDEGFGTLDQEKLEVVINTLEKLHDGNRMVGVITHVPELRNRMPRCLEIIPAQQDGIGSRIEIRTS
ncbi:AAA family ATPase [Phosphitispora sp. TUW77]|uniref:AAA family ATPase n=1 Tax=Phosphitispora sp. TUW77 TaxID=3152361 RepID=UPI003AB32F71